MSPIRADYVSDELRVFYKGSVLKMFPPSILQIDICQFADPLYGGMLNDDEEFQIFVEKERFWLFGPFVDGMLGALEELKRAHPEIPCRRAFVRRMPWKLREPGILGLRLFPIAGFGVFPLKDLSSMEMCYCD